MAKGNKADRKKKVAADIAKAVQDQTPTDASDSKERVNVTVDQFGYDFSAVFSKGGQTVLTITGVTSNVTGSLLKPAADNPDSKPVKKPRPPKKQG